MAFLAAVLLAVAAFVIGSIAWPWLPVGSDPGLGVLLVAAVLALAAFGVVVQRQLHSGRSILASAIRGLGVGAATVGLALVPVLLFVAYCFSSLNPDAPCLR